MNISELINDAEIDYFGNETASDIRNADESIRPMSSPTTFALLGIPVGTELEPITERCPKVITIDGKNLVRLQNGEEKPYLELLLM